ncbi:LamG-like jellyroll fold domain-containing protein [Roseimicrobium sp. ORNL1]|uniref:LamG-like jellyroll fold domain-containing protein n=1 Tax=Roseimicrobium sp. ORNL1 TaxID=2711231 RepID=UPI0013E1C090|nr:LamG-like jellyroll fold domain-containing protein [Roseimicrobium sp. ORNL1]QIF01690.1 hypothetical protein G5S37_09195 [Roseimicrobium sp. ORNL1]
MSDSELLQLQSWMHDLEEGRLEQGEMDKLQALILRSEEARRFYVQRMSMGSALCKLADEAQEAEQQHESEQQDDIITATAELRRPWPLSAKLAMAASLLACAVALVLAIRPQGRSQQGGASVAAETSNAGCAVLVDAAGAEWAEGTHAWQVGMSVPAGKLQLKSGLIRLEFYSGASVTLEGQSELEIVSVKEAKCAQGQMRVHVPPHARGFKLTTPDAEVVDLGTEFGLKVSDGGKAEVHVFDGEVEVLPNQATAKLSVKQGAGWDAAKGVSSSPATASASFVDLTALRAQTRSSDEQRLASWREGMSVFLKDPRLLVGYTFEPENEWERRVENKHPGAQEFSHGSIVGARWVPGRWQGKRALQFKSPGDRVRLTVPGKHDAITLAAWVQVDGIDRRFNSLFLTDTWTPGNPHWQFVQAGSFALGIHETGGRKGQHVLYSPEMFGPDTLGVWYHVASTFDMRTGVGRNYVNGKLVSEYTSTNVDQGEKILIGTGELGNWGLPEGSKPRTEVRTFNGRMDEFLLFGAALQPEEVARLYEVGKP